MMGYAAAENPVGVGKGRRSIRLVFLVPFFLSTAMFLSVVFSPVAGLPLVFANLRYGRMTCFLAAFTNLALVYSLSGSMNAAMFFVSAVLLGLSLSECLRYRLKLEITTLISVGMMVFATAMLLISYSMHFKTNPIHKLDSFVGSIVDQVALNVEKYKDSSAVSTQDLEKFLVDPEMTKKNILYELPSAFLIALISITVGNILLLLKLNLSGIRDRLKIKGNFFKYWKVTDYLVWPTLASGFCLVIEVPVVSDVALNIFKVLLSIYALQGLAILNFLFDQWGVKGFFRPLGYIMALAILLPLMISIGFFDMWFGFREKMKR